MVYLDYNASTPVDQRILPAIVDAHGAFGNPSSGHHASGQQAKELVDEARCRVANLVDRSVQDVVFTSGASEASVLAILGAMLGAKGRPNVVVSATEHKAVIAAAEAGARLTGGEVRAARVSADGLVDLTHLSELVDDSIAVVAVMAANNETGVIGPVTEAASIARESGALIFVDVTQLVGKSTVEGVVENADIMVCSSHKIYGPKGAGAIVADRWVQKAMVPIASGGGQERGIRGGTHNTPSIVGFGLAAELAQKEHVSDAVRIGGLAETLVDTITDKIGDVKVNGYGADRLSNTLNVRFVDADAEAVMASMPNVHVSAGSACQSANSTPSHVLLAMGLSATAAHESLRISLGRFTTEHDIEEAAKSIIDAVVRVRELTAD